MLQASASLFISSGALLLAVAALLGFQLHRSSSMPAATARWRVVHSGGTAGGVQLIALGAVWSKLALASATSVLATGALVAGTWLMFVGPLMTALARPRLGKWIAYCGAFISVPGYLLLIWFALLWR